MGISFPAPANNDLLTLDSAHQSHIFTQFARNNEIKVRQASTNHMSEAQEKSKPNLAIIVSIASLALLLVASPLVMNYELLYLAMQFVVISIVIWQACDPFADAAQWIGRKLRLPGSVRGATLDAVASSMPELFTGLFFVIVAASGTGDAGHGHDGDGFGASLATCAGSAVYNMILIPAFCVLMISYCRRSRPTIDVEPEVISRDGMWFLGAEAVLIAFMFQDQMYWWMGVVFLLMYLIYILQLLRDARVYQKAMKLIEEKLGRVEPDTSKEEIVNALQEAGMSTNPALVDQVRKAKAKEDDESEDEEGSAGFLYGLFDIPLNGWTAALIIVIATLVAGLSCYWLVEVARETAVALDIPVFFVAVILVAASSSVPDTFLSIGAAKRGDDSGAVSNAFGSNIFDICVSLSIPLLVNSYLIGWKPVPLTTDGEPIAGLVDLRILLAVLTGITLLIMWHNRQLTRAKGLALCGLYCLFIGYAVAGSMGFTLFK